MLEDLAGPVSAEAHRAYFEAAPDALLLLAPDGGCLETNAAARELLGREVGGESLLEGMVDPALLVVALAETARTGRWRGELRLRREDGGPAAVEAVLTSLPGQGAMVLSCRAAEPASAEIVGLIGHELRNPIASLKGYAQLMQRRGVYSEDAVRTIVRQSNRLNRQVGDLVDAARLAAGRFEPRRVEVDLLVRVRALLESVCDLGAGQRLVVDIPGEPIVGFWDRDRIEQVLDNLIGNAVKFSPAGGEIRVTVARAGSRVRFVVADVGLGMEPEALPRVFERYYRTEAAKASATKGIGLGLYVCKGLVEAMGGQIGIESVLGRGTTVTVELPIVTEAG